MLLLQQAKVAKDQGIKANGIVRMAYSSELSETYEYYSFCFVDKAGLNRFKRLQVRNPTIEIIIFVIVMSSLSSVFLG